MRRAGRVAQTIEKALRGEIRLGDAVAARGQGGGASAKTFVLAPEAMIDNNLSDKYTVIEVSGLDRAGLLFELTAALSDLNLNIGSAHVVTFGEKAVDVFYVTDLTGAKIVSPTREATIRERMLAIFNAGEPPPRPRRARAAS